MSELVWGNTLGETYFLFHQREVLLFREATASASLEKSFSMEGIVYRGWGCSGLNPLKPIEGRAVICLGREKK